MAKFNLELEGDFSESDVVDALNYAAELVEGGNYSGFLDNENIEVGSFEYHS